MLLRVHEGLIPKGGLRRIHMVDSGIYCLRQQELQAWLNILARGENIGRAFSRSAGFGAEYIPHLSRLENRFAFLNSRQFHPASVNPLCEEKMTPIGDTDELVSLGYPLGSLIPT